MVAGQRDVGKAVIKPCGQTTKGWRVSQVHWVGWAREGFGFYPSCKKSFGGRTD